MDLVVGPLVTAGAWREAIDPALWDECNMWPHPRLVLVHPFQGILLLVLPLHVLLLVADGIPPDVEQAVGPGAAADEEVAEVEAASVLWNDEVDGVGLAVANGGEGFGIEVGVGQWVGDVEWVVDVDVAVDVVL